MKSQISIRTASLWHFSDNLLPYPDILLPCLGSSTQHLLQADVVNKMDKLPLLSALVWGYDITPEGTGCISSCKRSIPAGQSQEDFVFCSPPSPQNELRTSTPRIVGWGPESVTFNLLIGQSAYAGVARCEEQGLPLSILHCSLIKWGCYSGKIESSYWVLVQ